MVGVIPVEERVGLGLDNSVPIFVELGAEDLAGGPEVHDAVAGQRVGSQIEPGDDVDLFVDEVLVARLRR